MNAPSLGFAVAPLTAGIGGVVTGLDLARRLWEAVVARLTSTHYATLDYLPEIRVMQHAAILGDSPV
jgi:hypothetical protein